MNSKVKEFLGDKVFSKFERNKIYKNDGDYCFNTAFIWVDTPEGHKYWSNLSLMFSRYISIQKDKLRLISQNGDVVTVMNLSEEKQKEMNIHKRMIERFGENTQSLVVIEEASEFSKELLKNINRNKSNRNLIVDEYHDLLFTLKYIKEIYEILDSETNIAMKAREAHCEELLK